jgi:hypothetical protein
MRNVLVVYYIKEAHTRATVLEHLYSFRAYSGARCFYLNMAAWRTPRYLARIDYDAVIFHYTIAGMRNMPELFNVLMDRLDFIRRSTAVKMLIPQDEYIHGDLLSWMVNHFGVSHVYSLVGTRECRRIYKTVDFEQVQFHTVLTGYVSDKAVRLVERLAKRIPREVDLGYRSWDPWPCLGRHGRLKGDVGHRAREAAERQGLSTDVSHNYEKPILGDEWYKFLLRCRYVVGVEGGSSVLDYDGSICDQTRALLSQRPSATFEEVERACFPQGEGSVDYIMLSPRHFESCISRTGQALIEGQYNGVLRPGEHYLEIRKDFSNIDEVVEAMKSEEQRLAMVERAYRDVVASGTWSYRRFVEQVLLPVYQSEPRTAGRGPAATAVQFLRFARCAVADAALPFRWHLRSVLQRAIGARRLQAIIERLKGFAQASEAKAS